MELNEEFIAVRREEQSLWDVMFSLYREINEKDKGERLKKLKRLRFLIERYPGDC